MGPLVACKPYPIPLKYQKFVNEVIKLLENAGCTSKSLSPLATPVIIVSKKPDPLNAHKQQLHLVLDYRSLNKAINAAHNGTSILSYYPLPSMTYLLARLHNCTIFSSLDLRSGYHYIGLTPHAKPKTAFTITSGKWHCNVAPFGICSLPGVFCYLMSQVLSSLHFCFAYLDDILVYGVPWKEHLQHQKVFFQCLKEANLKIKTQQVSVL